MADADGPQLRRLPCAYPSQTSTVLSDSIFRPQSSQRTREGEHRRWHFRSWRHPLSEWILEQRLQFDALHHLLLLQRFLLKPNRFSLIWKRTGKSWFSRSTRSWMKLFPFSTPTRSTKLCVTRFWLTEPSELLRLCASPPVSSSASIASLHSLPPVLSKWFFLVPNFTFLDWVSL